jgi:hypothetical protein
MTNKRRKQLRDAGLIEKMRPMRMVGAVLDRLLPEFKTWSPAVVRTRHGGPFSGAPDNFNVSIVFATRAEAQCACDKGLIQVAADRVRAALLGDGYSSEAASTFRFHPLSEEEIEAAGGEWMYDRA